MLTLFFTFLALAVSVHADIPDTPVAGQYEIKGQFDYLSSSANYRAGGGSSSGLAAGATFQNMMGRAQVTYDLAPQWRAYAGFSGGQTTADVINNSNSTPTSLVTDSHTSTGFNDASVGAQFWQRFGNVDVAPQADLIYPIFRANISGTDPLIGEGALRLQAGGWLMWHWRDFTPYGYAAYAYRDEGRASLLPYKVGLRYGQKQKWWIEGEFRGFETITNDTNTSNRTVRELYLNRVDGGSFQFYSINPSVGEVALIGGLQFESLGIYAGAATTVYGRSMADSWSAVVGVTFTGAIFAPVVRREEFNPRPDKYDEGLFKEKIVPEADITPLPLIAPKPRAQGKPRAERVRKVRKAAQPEPSVELLMKQTEKTLEKKDN